NGEVARVGDVEHAVRVDVDGHRLVERRHVVRAVGEAHRAVAGERIGGEAAGRDVGREDEDLVGGEVDGVEIPRAVGGEIGDVDEREAGDRLELHGAAHRVELHELAAGVEHVEEARAVPRQRVRLREAGAAVGGGRLPDRRERDVAARQQIAGG